MPARGECNVQPLGRQNENKRTRKDLTNRQTWSRLLLRPSNDRHFRLYRIVVMFCQRRSWCGDAAWRTSLCWASRIDTFWEISFDRLIVGSGLRFGAPACMGGKKCSNNRQTKQKQTNTQGFDESTPNPQPSTLNPQPSILDP